MSFTLFINGDALPAQEAVKVVKNIQKPKILEANGGFLLRIEHKPGITSLGLLPTLSDGERNKHYQIKLPSGEGARFTGFLKANYQLTLLPEADSDQSIDQSVYLPLYKSLSTELIEAGFHKTLPLDWITCKALEEIGWNSAKAEQSLNLEDLS